MRRFEEEVPAKSVDAGPETKNGVATERWHFKGYFPVEQVSDFWFAGNGTNQTLVQAGGAKIRFHI
jgi:hypothetical protein